ncbi:XRE family transcriptional regulator [Paenalcaligenes sp.]|uniref:helix-turn-helix domain-containing protein n=1 Tax=Paenalcaligenes sp. TaxID=1966342 RepID=UPI00263714E1|nr:XRE family transcriptional regulator [Paenalcaligenes sp.]
MTLTSIESRASALAERIRSLRLQRGWTLEQMSKNSGVAISTLSKIENGLSSPTYDVLLRLAHGFQLDVAELFAPAQEHMGAGRRTIERKGNGEKHETPLYDHLVLCSQLANKRIMPFISKIKAHDVEVNEGWSSHAGEEFVYVLSGTIELHTEFYQPTVLEPGDCFYIDSRMKHRVINHGPEQATVLWISTRPDHLK